MADRLILFHRLLQRGRVKSRLASGIGADGALAVYRAMLEELERNLAGLGDILYPLADRSGDRERSAFPGSAVQVEGDLGERMAAAFREAFADGCRRVLLAGSDIPDLDADLVRRYLDMLRTCDRVIGPSDDGGYYLIGFTPAGFDPELFRDISWGTGSVLQETVRKAAVQGKPFRLGPSLPDIDTKEDLRSLLRRRGAETRFPRLFAAGKRYLEDRTQENGQEC